MPYGLGRSTADILDAAGYRVDWHDYERVYTAVVDYLMTRGNDRFSTYMREIKRPIKDGSEDSLPTTEEMLKHQRAALEAAWKLDASGIEKAWQAYVRKQY